MLSDCPLLIFFLKSLKLCPIGGLGLINIIRRKKLFHCIYMNYFDL